jgi:hypothetical protein
MNKYTADVIDTALIVILTVAVLMLSGCAGMTLENSIGVDPTDNAVLCATATIDPAWSESTIQYKRIEIPSSMEVTPDQLATLVRACQGN